MAEKKKKKSRIKKFLKTLGKVALAGGAAYGASKMFGGRKSPVSTVGQAVGTNRAAHRPAHLGLKSYTKSPLPEHLTSDMGASAYTPDKKWYKPTTWFSAKGGRAGAAKGGRVGVGIAKRGFGRALMKGKK